MLNNIKTALKREKITCLFGSWNNIYLPLHPVSELKALTVNRFLSVVPKKTMFRGETTVLEDSPG